MSDVEATFNDEHVEILKHTAKCAGGLYCGGSPEMDLLVERGYMESAGRKSFVPDEYYRLTGKGKQLVSVLNQA